MRPLPTLVLFAIVLSLASAVVNAATVETSEESMPSSEVKAGSDEATEADWARAGRNPKDKRALTADPQLVTMQFRDAPIDSMLERLAQTLHVAFIKSGELKETVSIINAQKMPPEEALQLVEAALALKGYSLVRLGPKLYQIVGKDRVVATGAPLIRDPSQAISATGEFVTTVVRLKHAKPDILSDALEDLVDTKIGEKIVCHEPAGALVISATARNLERLVRLVETLDVPDIKLRKVTAVIDLEHASPITVVKQLNAMMGKDDPNPTTLVPESRLKKVIVSASDRKRIEQIRDLIRNLDQPGSKPPAQVARVYRLKRAPAATVAGILSALYGDVKTASAAPSEDSQDLQYLNSPKGDSDESIFDTPSAGPAGGATQGATHGAVIVKEKADRPNRSLSADQAGPSIRPPSHSVRIVAEPLTNSLAILASEEDHAQVEETIAALDINPMQVLVEVVIAEVQMSRGHHFGIDLANLSGSNDIRTDFGKLAKNDGNNTNLTGMRAYVLSGDSFRALVHALHTDANVNVLASPKLFANNNQDAQILIGRQMPVLTGRTVTSGGNLLSNVDYKDVGTKLKIRPQINLDKAVTLKLQQEVKTVTGTGVEGNPILDTRQAQTTATVMDGEAVVIGGLLQDEDSVILQRVPGLGRLPILKWFFGTRDRETSKRELVFVFRPHVVEGPGTTPPGVPSEASRMSSYLLDKSPFRDRNIRAMPVSVVPYSKYVPEHREHTREYREDLRELAEARDAGREAGKKADPTRPWKLTSQSKTVKPATTRYLELRQQLYGATDKPTKTKSSRHDFDRTRIHGSVHSSESSSDRSTISTGSRLPCGGCQGTLN